jgi:hypothetical protein
VVGLVEEIAEERLPDHLTEHVHAARERRAAEERDGAAAEARAAGPSRSCAGGSPT